MIRRPPRSTLDRSSAASDVYKRQAQDDTPPAGSLFNEIIEAARAYDVAKHTLNVAALGDRHLRLRDGAMARKVDGRAAQEMQDADALRPAFLRHANEFLGGPLKPRRHHDAVVVPDGRETLPVSSVTPDCPVLDQITNLQTLDAFVAHDSSVAKR